MAKVTVCDVCKKKGKLTETTRYYTVKKKPYLRLDYCEECKSLIPKPMVDYVKFVYLMTTGIELTTEQAQEHARRSN